ncbi:hypothetical protein PUNSTDRAFT_54288, partial [Punctularia strigosozonata HHB-11173 SS5]|uniref:uncharacterized protein n=1 Tax=Punctularia strigosozonata (strain HHB-11173) TaxID=741275 RepID=UPI0004417EDC
MERVSADFGSVTAPGHHVVDIMPWLAYLPGWMPGMGFKRIAAEMRKTLSEGKNMPVALRQRADGSRESSAWFYFELPQRDYRGSCHI